jgi:hypothetical protein
MTPRLTWFAGTVLVLAACLPPTQAERGTVRRWLLCEECNEGELDSVVALGGRVVKVLGEALEGPPASGRENIRLQAGGMFARIPSPLVTQGVYIQHFVDNYVATYQSRAAMALALIPTPAAHQLLLNAIRNDSAYRDDVRRVLGASAQVSLDTAAGGTQSAPANSFVRINPTVVVRDTSDSAAPQLLDDVRVAFRVESGGGQVSDSDQITRGSGSASVRWQLGPGLDSLNVLRAEAAGQTVYFRATGRGPGLRLEFVTQPGNVRAGDTLATAVRVAVVDAWGQTDPAFAGIVELFVVGTAATWIQPIVGGEAVFPGLSFGGPAPAQRLLARVGGAAQAVSDPFDILP